VGKEESAPLHILVEKWIRQLWVMVAAKEEQ
jgi:hypothetical protein